MDLSGLVWSTQQVPEQPGLYREPCIKKTRKENKTKTKKARKQVKWQTNAVQSVTIKANELNPSCKTGKNNQTILSRQTFL